MQPSFLDADPGRQSDQLDVGVARSVGAAGAEPAPAMRQVRDVLAIFGFGLPIAAYFGFIHHYGVNAIWGDQWYNISLLGHPLTLSALWAQHSEHRIFFPNLFVVALAHTTHLNIVFEEFLSGVMLCLTLGLLVRADKRYSPSRPWLYYCPVAFLMLSFVQSVSTLFGFQLSWYLGLLAFAVALSLLDNMLLTSPALVGAIAAGVVGSFSVFEGLFVWPIGLLVLYRRRCRRSLVLAWIAAAAVTAVVFFYRYNFYESNSYWFTHPAATAKFFFLAIGDIVGSNVSDAGSGNAAVLVLGIVIFSVGCWVIVVFALRRGKAAGSSIGVALVCFGLAFAAFLTVGRVDAGLLFAGSSQYTTFSLMTLVGCYFAVLNAPESPAAELRLQHSAWRIVRLIVLGLVVLQVTLGNVNGLSRADQIHQAELGYADIAANINRAPNALVKTEVGNTATWIRNLARIAEADRLSLFATSDAARYRREGLFPQFSNLRVSVVVPAQNATVSGTVVVDAATATYLGVTQVSFSVASTSTPETWIGRGAPTLAGWLLHWDTTALPNGTYRLSCEALASNGERSVSRPVVVRVSNG